MVFTSEGFLAFDLDADEYIAGWNAARNPGHNFDVADAISYVQLSLNNGMLSQASYYLGFARSVRLHRLVSTK